MLLQRMLLKVQARQVSLPEQGDSSNARSSASTRSFSECFRLAEQGCSITSCPSLGCLDTQCQWVNKVRSPIIGVHAQSPLLVLQTSSSWFNTCPTYFPPKDIPWASQGESAVLFQYTLIKSNCSQKKNNPA